MLLLLIIISLGYYFLYQTFGIGIKCVIHELTGLYCPGCGISRMLFSLIELNFYQAFRYNPLVFSLMLAYIIYIVIRFIKTKDISLSTKVGNKTVYILLIIVILFGIARNIELFNYLKPTIIS